MLKETVPKGRIPMSIVVTLSPELEAVLRDKAAQKGQDVSLVAAELLANVLEWEAQDSVEAIQGIQKGLDDFKAGRFRSFQEFTEEQRSKHNLSTGA
jgi:predicted transcriptional regulator